VRKTPGWEDLSPLEMLREAGRIVCDARTFEAVGRIEIRSERSEAESGKIRWVFGPDGEYRFEQGSVVVVHDTDCVAFAKDGVWGDSVLRTREYQPRREPHKRYPGDMVMATGMAARTAMTYPTAAARLVGASWTDHLFSEEAVLELGEDSLIAGHPCRTIFVNDPGEAGKLTFWIDSDLGLIRKWKFGTEEDSRCTVYEQLRLNPRLAPGEFKIPNEVKRAEPPLPEQLNVGESFADEHEAQQR
jgi:hypothetical protein